MNNVILISYLIIVLLADYYVSHNDYDLKKYQRILIGIGMVIGYYLIYRKYSLSSTMINFLIIFIILLLSSILDIKKRIVPIKLFLVVIPASIVILVIQHDTKSLINLVITIIVFGILGAISYWSHNGFGFGDVLIITMMTYFLGWQLVMSMFLITLAIIGVYGLVLITIKRVSRKTELPFVPFLFLVFILYIVL